MPPDTSNAVLAERIDAAEKAREVAQAAHAERFDRIETKIDSVVVGLARLEGAVGAAKGENGNGESKAWRATVNKWAPFVVVGLLSGGGAGPATAMLARIMGAAAPEVSTAHAEATK